MTVSPKAEQKVSAQYVFEWTDTGAMDGFYVAVILNVTQDAATPSGPGITELSLPLTFARFIL